MEIQEIKTRLSIHTVLRHYHLTPGRHHMLRCPFHDDDRPSLKIYPNTNTFHCFGCGANGDVIEFIQLKENCSKHAALVKASELAGGPAATTAKVSEPVNPAPSIQPGTVSHTGILTKIFTYFKNGLKSGIAQRPKEYLQSRNLNYELLELGYNSGQFHHRGKLSEADTKACVAPGC